MRLEQLRGIVARTSATIALAAVTAGCEAPITVVQQEHCVGRRDTPWCPMSDAELAAAVDSAGGRVFIGFRDPDENAGVTELGEVLASDASVAAGKALLRSLKIEITFEFELTPSVVARMPGALVRQVRANPYIEYIEPIFPGTYN